jgi:hypothetical protein
MELKAMSNEHSEVNCPGIKEYAADDLLDMLHVVIGEGRGLLSIASHIDEDVKVVTNL